MSFIMANLDAQSMILHMLAPCACLVPAQFGLPTNDLDSIIGIAISLLAEEARYISSASQWQLLSRRSRDTQIGESLIEKTERSWRSCTLLADRLGETFGAWRSMKELLYRQYGGRFQEFFEARFRDARIGAGSGVLRPRSCPLTMREVVEQEKLACLTRREVVEKAKTCRRYSPFRRIHDDGG